jgi:hypothetical protein
VGIAARSELHWGNSYGSLKSQYGKTSFSEEEFPPTTGKFFQNSYLPTHQEFSSYRGSLSTSFWMKARKLAYVEEIKKSSCTQSKIKREKPVTEH